MCDTKFVGPLKRCYKKIILNSNVLEPGLDRSAGELSPGKCLPFKDIMLHNQIQKFIHYDVQRLR